MKCNYKGFELSVTREKCLGGWNQVYIWAYHNKIGEVISDHCDDSDTVASHMKYLKKTIDDMLENPNDWELDEDQVREIIAMV
jgi:hypothetical protein